MTIQLGPDGRLYEPTRPAKPYKRFGIGAYICMGVAGIALMGAAVDDQTPKTARAPDPQWDAMEKRLDAIAAMKTSVRDACYAQGYGREYCNKVASKAVEKYQ